MAVRMARPAVTGAVFPGRERAQMARTPRRRAASKSTPADVGIGYGDPLSLFFGTPRRSASG